MTKDQQLLTDPALKELESYLNERIALLQPAHSALLLDPKQVLEDSSADHLNLIIGQVEAGIEQTKEVKKEIKLTVEEMTPLREMSPSHSGAVGASAPVCVNIYNRLQSTVGELSKGGKWVSSARKVLADDRYRLLEEQSAERELERRREDYNDALPELVERNRQLMQKHAESQKPIPTEIALPPDPGPGCIAQPTLPDEFWEESEFLTYVKTLAAAIPVSPEAVLGAYLVAATLKMNPRILLGTEKRKSPICLGVLYSGESGAGKSATMDKSFRFLDLTPDVDFGLTIPSSGEAILSGFLGPEHQAGDPLLHESILVTFDEISKMYTKSEHSSLQDIMKSGLSASTIGSDVKGQRFTVMGGEYVMANQMGMQPELVGPMLDQRGGGLPQRFFTVTVDTFSDSKEDLDAARAKMKATYPNDWPLPPDVPNPPPGSFYYVGVDQVALDEADQIILNKGGTVKTLRTAEDGDMTGLDSHKAAITLRLACLLGYLSAGTLIVTPRLWELAKLLYKYSTASLEAAWQEGAYIEAAKRTADLTKQESQRSTARDRATDGLFESCAKRVTELLIEAGSNGLSGSDLRSQLSDSQRKFIGHNASQTIDWATENIPAVTANGKRLVLATDSPIAQVQQSTEYDDTARQSDTSQWEWEDESDPMADFMAGG